MRHLRLLLPLALAAGCLLSIANAHPSTSGAPPDPVITAADQPADAVTAASDQPAAPDVAERDAEVAVPRVLAIETSDPSATVVTAFALFLPARPRPLVLAGLVSPLLKPYDDGVPIAVKRWAGRRAPRFNC